ncbi:MAG: hypothetical protein V3R29_10305 [Candidatus Acidoferrales bacterium]
MKTKFEQPGTFPRLGPIGRTVRVLAGAALLYFLVYSLLTRWQGWVETRAGWGLPGGTWFIGVALALYLLPVTVDRLLTVNWGWRSQAVWGTLLLGLAAFDFFYYQSLWAPPLGGFLLLSIVGVFGVIGLSFLVQAVAATPG